MNRNIYKFAWPTLFLSIYLYLYLHDQDKPNIFSPSNHKNILQFVQLSVGFFNFGSRTVETYLMIICHQQTNEFGINAPSISFILSATKNLPKWNHIIRWRDYDFYRLPLKFGYSCAPIMFQTRCFTPLFFTGSSVIWLKYNHKTKDHLHMFLRPLREPPQL